MRIVEHTYTLNGKLVARKKTTKIILHCSATPDGRDYTAEQIDAWHKNKGWTCIGYHYVIYRDGTIHRGRPEDVKGAHASEQNPVSIGICYIGGCDRNGKGTVDTRTRAQKKSMYELVDYLLKKYGLSLEDVHGHYEYANKECPSFKIQQFKREFSEWKG